MILWDDNQLSGELLPDVLPSNLQVRCGSPPSAESIAIAFIPLIGMCV